LRFSLVLEKDMGSRVLGKHAAIMALLLLLSEQLLLNSLVLDCLLLP